MLEQVSVLRPLVAEPHSTTWIDHTLFIRSSTHGLLACFHFVGKAMVNIRAQARAWTDVSVSLQHPPGRGIAGVYGHLRLDLLRDHRLLSNVITPLPFFSSSFFYCDKTYIA